MKKQYLKRLPLIAVMATVMITQTGCLAVATQIVAENLAMMTKAHMYRKEHGITKVTDIDLRKTKNPEVSKEQIEFVKNGGMLQIMPAENKLKSITHEELKLLQQASVRIDSQTQLPFSYHIAVGLNSSEQDLIEVAEVAVARKSVVFIKGLKNDSLAETIIAIKPFTERNIPVLIAPVQFAVWGGNVSPIFINGYVLPDGRVTCPEDFKGECKPPQMVVGLKEKQKALDL